MTIRIKLLLTLIFMSLLTVSLLAYISTESAKRTILIELEDSLNGIIDVTAERIYNFIEEKELLTASFAENEETGRALVDINQFYNLGVESDAYLTAEYLHRIPFHNLVKRYQLHDIFLINVNGDIIFTVKHELDFATNLNNGAYKDTALANSYRNAIGLLETNITSFAPYSPTTVAANKRKSEKGETSKIFASAFISTPVFHKGELVGVFAIQVNSQNYYHLSQDYSGLKQTGRILIGQLENEEAMIISPLRHSPDASFKLSYAIGSKVAIPLQRAVTGNRGSGNSIAHDTSSIIAAWRYVPELGWGIVAHMPIEEALIPVNELRKIFVISGLILMFFTALVALFFARKLSKPITQLSKAVRLLSDGNLDQQIKVSGKDEISELSNSFNNMLEMRKMHEQSISNADKETKQLLSELNQQKYALDQHSIVAITDIKGNITFCNQRLLDISGYSHEELIGQNHRLLNSGYHPKDFFTEMYKVISKGKVWNAEVCNKTKGGQLYWVDTTIIPFMDDLTKKGEQVKQVKSYIAIRTDITHKKQQELSLIKAIKEAEQAVISKGEFLASMSHEIRTPMNGVLGMLGLLLNSKLDSDQKHKVNIAQSSAKSLLTLINDILDFSKVEAGKLELENLDFNLRKVLGDFADSIAHQAQGKGLELILDITHVNESNVIGDSSRLRQILYNIVGNAIKFTTAGEIVIAADIQSLDDKYWQFNCRITDTGIGIPEDKLKSLFDSFSQVDASTTRKYGGTGLGLAIVKKLCELMEGEVKVTSELGKGTCFSVELKLMKSNHSKIVIPQIEMNKLNLLIVDDNKTNRDVLRGQLEHWGASVWEAESGKQALDICEERSNQKDTPFFDIALLDMQMPDMHGGELGQLFKSNPAFETMKLVMMTSVGHKGDAKYFADLGFSAYFPKPATTSDIFDALSVVVDGGDSLTHADPLVTSRYLQTLDKTSLEDTQTKWPEKTRILLVEDNQINQMVASGILAEMGLHVDVAGHGGEALDSLRDSPSRDPFTLILMDCQMPEMDGYEATRQIRKAAAGARFKDIPIIAMTANAMEGDREICLAAGMSDYVSKPIEPEILKNILIKWLKATESEIVEPEMPINTDLEISDTVVSEEETTENIDAALKIWDKDAALKRLMNNQSLLIKLLDSFIEENLDSINSIKDSVQSKDCNALRQAAHSLKGVAANLGGLELQNKLSKLETLAKNDNLEAAFELMPKIELANQSLIECFEGFLKETRSTDSTDTIELSNEKMETILSSLNQQLVENEFIDTEELSPLKNAGKKGNLQEKLNLLVSQVEQFDNDSAIKTMGEILKIAKINFDE